MYLLEMDRLIKMPPGLFKIHFWDNQLFPDLTAPEVHNNLRKLMRSVVTDPEEGKRRNKRMQKLILEKFTWNTTGNLALQRLREINKKLKGT